MPLDMIYLADVVINKHEQKEVAENFNYYDDINRYTTLRPDWEKVYYSKKASYLISHDEYGDAFSGSVPIYSVEKKLD